MQIVNNFARELYSKPKTKTSRTKTYETKTLKTKTSKTVKESTCLRCAFGLIL